MLVTIRSTDANVFACADEDRQCVRVTASLHCPEVQREFFHCPAGTEHVCAGEARGASAPCASSALRLPRPFLLELAEAAAEAPGLIARQPLRLEPAKARLEVADLGAAPAVLTLVELALALGE